MTLRDGALGFLNLLALATGVAYAVLAARRNRLCWIAGAVSSVCAAILSAINKLPMQAALQVFYVGMSVYGWWSWRRISSDGELSVGVWPLGWHLGAALVLVAAVARQRALAATRQCRRDWPLLDSLTTWFSLFATWLAARARLENWLYWIVINAVMVFLFYAQEVWGMAVLSVLLMGIAASGFVVWRRRLRAQAVVGMITDGMLQHVPGCENGDAPYLAGADRRRQGQSQFPGAHATRPLRGAPQRKHRVGPGSRSGARAGAAQRRGRRRHCSRTSSTPARIIPASITDYVEGRLWTPHYFTRMRDLRALGPTPRHAARVGVRPPVARFDPMATARRYAETIIRGDPARWIGSATC